MLFEFFIISGVLCRMDWPPQSPDLNPIEQIWELLDSSIHKMARSSKDSVWNSLQEAWDNISNEVLQSYIFTMPERCQAVINARGGHTRY